MTDKMRNNAVHRRRGGTHSSVQQHKDHFSFMTKLSPPKDVDPLQREVLDWYLRRQCDGWTVEDENEFQAWLDSDAAHSAAYLQWHSHWKTLDGMPFDTLQKLRLNLERDKLLEAREAQRSRPRRKLLAPVLAFAAVSCIVGVTALQAWNHWQAQPIFAQAFGTLRGQQVAVPLPDGSNLRLDTATRLAVAYSRQRREVQLFGGQAVFSVQSEAHRPFHVLAGPVRVTVTGTRFSVRFTPDQAAAAGVVVSVEEGDVNVALVEAPSIRSESGEPWLVDLAAGQQLRIDAKGIPSRVTAVPGEGIAPWRDNRISFLDTPLSQAINELERYRRTGLTIRDPAVAALRLSGTFDLRDAQSFRQALSEALPVRLEDVGDFTEVLLDR